MVQPLTWTVLEKTAHPESPSTFPSHGLLSVSHHLTGRDKQEGNASLNSTMQISSDWSGESLRQRAEWGGHGREIGRDNTLSCGYLGSLSCLAPGTLKNSSKTLESFHFRSAGSFASWLPHSPTSSLGELISRVTRKRMGSCF